MKNPSFQPDTCYRQEGGSEEEEKAEKIGEENKRDARKIFLPTEEELQNHKKMLKSKSIRKPLWLSQ